jgi:hypothetical protein
MLIFKHWGQGIYLLHGMTKALERYTIIEFNMADFTFLKGTQA